MTPEDTGRLFIKSKTVTKPISGPVHVCTLEDYSVIIYYKWNKTSIFFTFLHTPNLYHVIRPLKKFMNQK